MTYDDAFQKLLDDGVLVVPPKDAVFDFVDAILDDKPKLAFQLYQECIDVGEAVLVMITNLYNSAKAVLQVQACQSKDVSKATGLTGWQIQNARKHINVYRNGELIYIMELCQQAEKGIKTGTMSDTYAMQYIMLNVM